MTKETTTSGSETNTKYKLVCCLNCLHANLHRYDNNPILAACKCKPQPYNERFPYEVVVARHLRKCSCWKLDPSRKTVEQRSKVA